MCLALFLYSFFFAQQPAWRLADGTKGFRISDVEFYCSNPDSLYALGDRSFLLSTDRGEHWDSISPGFRKGSIKIDPFDSKRIYLNHEFLPYYGNQILLSTDGGINWTWLFGGMASPFSLDLPIIEIDPVDLNTIYIDVVPNIFYRSSDRGNTWDSLPSPNGNALSSLSIAPSNSNIIYAAYGIPTQIYKSIDRGNTWTQLPFPIFLYTSSICLAIHPRNSEIVYASVFSYGSFPGGVYKSTDGGSTWEEKNNGLTNDDWDINAMVINTKNPNEIYIGTGSADHKLLFKTIDGGNNWFTFYDGLPDSAHVSSISIDTLNGRLYSTVRSSRDSSGIYIYDALTSITEGTLEPSETFLLSQNYPNPFNLITIISYDLPERVNVNLAVYDVLGREVIHLVNGYQPAGNYLIELNAAGLPGGVYFYCLHAGTRRFIRKALLIK